MNKIHSEMSAILLSRYGPPFKALYTSGCQFCSKAVKLYKFSGLIHPLIYGDILVCKLCRKYLKGAQTIYLEMTFDIFLNALGDISLLATQKAEIDFYDKLRLLVYQFTKNKIN